jgi:hypothetical protein
MPVAMTKEAAEAATIIVILLNMNSSSTLWGAGLWHLFLADRHFIRRLGPWSSMVHR